jgi:hypothetical protein
MTTLFAQARQGAAAPDPDFAALMGPTFLIVMLGVIAVAFIILIFYLLTLSKALSRCRPRNRTMEPGQVWLMLIPLFNIVWQFFIVNRVPQSIAREYRSRGWRAKGDFGKSIGMTMCITGLLSWIPFLGILLALVNLV